MPRCCRSVAEWFWTTGPGPVVHQKSLVQCQPRPRCQDTFATLHATTPGARTCTGMDLESRTTDFSVRAYGLADRNAPLSPSTLPLTRYTVDADRQIVGSTLTRSK